MSSARRIFDLYINSSMHVAFAVTAFTAITLDLKELGFSKDLLFFIFFGTITGYNFVKYAGIAQLHHRRLTDALKVIQLFSFLCFIGLICFTVRVGWPSILACLPLAALTLFYAVPIKPWGDNLRTAPTLKIFVIAAVWAGATVYLPSIYNNTDLNFDLFLMILQRFLLVLPLIVPFEIRDLHYDDLKLATLPQIIGVKRTKIFGYLLLLGTIIICFFKTGIFKEDIYCTTIIALMAAIGIYFASVRQSRYYASFWVEGIPIFYWLLSQLDYSILAL